MGTFSLHKNTLLNKSQVINFIIEVVVTDRFHCICMGIENMKDEADAKILFNYVSRLQYVLCT